MSQSPVVVNNSVVVPGGAVTGATVVAPQAPAPSPAAPEPTDQLAKFSLNVIAVVFLILAFAALKVAVNGSEDGVYWGVMSVLNHVHDYHSRNDRDILLSITAIIPFLGAAFFVCLAVGVTQKKGFCCVVALAILLTVLFFAFVPSLSLNPAAALMDSLSWQQAAQLSAAWRHFGYCGLSIGISLKIFVP